MTTLHLRRPAMATLFEAWLVGDDPEHLEATGHAALAEVARVERLLSRFDPASEVSRVNREAARVPVRVEVELFHILRDCLEWCRRTGGFFDVSAPGVGPARQRRSIADLVLLDPDRRTVRFAADGVRLDFGGYGKGYALDRVARLLEEFGVASALVHGGTSSVLARGARADGAPWQVGVQDPFGAEHEAGTDRVELRDDALSYSAALGGRYAVSDVVDPHTGKPLETQAACVVIAPAAATAEVLSTALLAMGRERAERFAADHAPAADAASRIGWLDHAAGPTVLSWLTPVPTAR